MKEDSKPGFAKDEIPLLEEELRNLKEKLHPDYPGATSEQLELAIGNALKASRDPFDQAEVEKATRHHLGHMH